MQERKKVLKSSLSENVPKELVVIWGLKGLVAPSCLEGQVKLADTGVHMSQLSLILSSQWGVGDFFNLAVDDLSTCIRFMDLQQQLLGVGENISIVA